jgi:hypothetical protein
VVGLESGLGGSKLNTTVSIARVAEDDFFPAEADRRAEPNLWTNRPMIKVGSAPLAAEDAR